MVHSRSWPFSVLAVSIYLALTAFTLYSMWIQAGHHLVYALDDPYIHLALAERIAAGHYGINVGEPSSPSSSLLWPFLLVPTIKTQMSAYMPLVWNVLASCLSCVLIGRFVSELPAKGAKSPGQPGTAWRIATVIALILASNLVGMTTLGMEHGLQLLLSITCAYGLTRVLSRGEMPLWCVIAAAVAPWIRYEDVALTFAVGVALVALGQSRRAIIMALVAILPLVGFSLFLHAHGLPLFPLSVLVKGKVADQHANVIMRAAHTLGSGVLYAIVDEKRWPLLLGFVGLCWSIPRQTDRIRRLTVAGAAAAVGLHLLIGRFGWLFRYEVYALSFAAILLVYLLHQEEYLPPLAWYFLALGALAIPYVEAIHVAPQASRDIYQQQFQMARFAHDFYNGNVAINDLGLVSYHMPPSRYIFDVLGLGTAEAAREPNKSAQWLQSVMERHDIGLVMVYGGSPIPSSWQPLGSMCIPTALLTPCVDFWASKPQDAPYLRTQFQRFQATTPAEDTFRPLTH